MIVTDSSSLILLAKSDILDIIINNAKQKLIIPEQVYYECTAKKELFDAQIIEKRVKEKLITQKNISNKSLYTRILKDFNLGKGETESITLCIELKSGLITDDKKAINACRILKIKFTTVPRLVVYLYKKNIVTEFEAKSIIKKLQKFGRYSDEILNNIKEDLKWKDCKM